MTSPPTPLRIPTLVLEPDRDAVPVKHHRFFSRRLSSSLAHLRLRNATISSRPSKNSSRLRHLESSVYASDTFSGLRVFHASWAIFTFCLAVSSSNGGSGGLTCCSSPLCCIR